MNPSTHPFAAPCQPFFYGQVDSPQPRLDVTGNLHDFSIDFDSFTLTRPGLSASTQEEQTKQLNVVTTLSGLTFIDSTGTNTTGNLEATSDADDEVETTAATTAGGTFTTIGALSLSHLNADCCNQIGLIASVPAGEQEHRSASVAAKVTDTYACPTTGTRETDSLSCAGGHVRAAGTTTVSIPVTHVTAGVGAANLVRIEASGVDTIATIDRDASAGTSEDGLIDVSTSRTIGTVQLGGFPSSGMAAPAGMSTNQTLDTNYCVRLVGYSDTAHAIAGERQATNPSASISAGTFFYYNGAGYSNKTTTDATLDTLTVTCSKTQVVRCQHRDVARHGRRGRHQARHHDHVADRGPGRRPDPLGRRGDHASDRDHDPLRVHRRRCAPDQPVATFDPGDLFAHGIYQPPPAAQT